MSNQEAQRDLLGDDHKTRNRRFESGGRERRVFGPERWLARRLLQLVGSPPVGLELWNGELVAPPGVEPRCRAVIRDRDTLFTLLRNPNLHFGDAYASGRIEVEGDLVEFLELVYRHMDKTARNPLLWEFSERRRRPQRNTLRGSRRNIHQHYDIGNDFYKLWLDEAMVYTCAYFPDADADLETAQRAKMDHVCRKLDLKPGEEVLEVGCGWGSLARHMARHYGVRVKAYNISREQVAYARERTAAEGLDDRVEFVLDDYRNASGRFDAFVSVGMLEHVGTDHYGELGAVIDRCLSPTGRGLIHSIGQNTACPMNSWIEKRIFPGAYPPTLREMMGIFEPFAMSVLDVENLRLHYARTLEHWLARYEQVYQDIVERFDEFFARAWRLYLAGSVAAFKASSLQLFQVVFARPDCDDMPLTRAHLYR